MFGFKEILVINYPLCLESRFITHSNYREQVQQEICSPPCNELGQALPALQPRQREALVEFMGTG